MSDDSIEDFNIISAGGIQFNENERIHKSDETSLSGQTKIKKLYCDGDSQSSSQCCVVFILKDLFIYKVFTERKPNHATRRKTT